VEEIMRGNPERIVEIQLTKHKVKSVSQTPALDEMVVNNTTN
jgi:hypothetical protein